MNAAQGAGAPSPQVSNTRRGRPFSLGLLAIIACSLFLQGAEPAKVRVVLVGDSTMASKSGWGDAFGKLLGDRAEWFNEARGGQSSKSFRDQGLWKKALAHQPTWVLIQFGHNDQPGKGPARETDPATTYSENLGRFIDEARASGAKPVLVTSLTRRSHKDGKLVETGLTPYVEAARKVAAAKTVPLADLHARSIQQLEKLTPAEVAELEPAHPKVAGEKDHTHLTVRGGEMIAPLVVDELRKVAPELAALCSSAK